MQTLKISTLTICGIDELPGQRERGVSHVLSIVDPDWPELEAFQSYGIHDRTILQFHDIIDAAPDRVLPQQHHVTEILNFGSRLLQSAEDRVEGHLLVHCHMGVSRSTAAMLTLMAQASPDEAEDRLFERLRTIRPQAWPNSLMIGYADEQLGRKGRLVSELHRHYAVQLKRDAMFEELMTRIGRTRELEMGRSAA
ncbi:protein-tyrosine-phosphatase [Phyllobacterium sp. CCNWLW109]|uniref:tyrosine phosphatase family protein n=1 Tax=Phyllobacterium sp. CCNWLW109 TaxID=3127479 RepID=UPI00307881FD